MSTAEQEIRAYKCGSSVFMTGSVTARSCLSIEMCHFWNFPGVKLLISFKNKLHESTYLESNIPPINYGLGLWPWYCSQPQGRNLFKLKLLFKQIRCITLRIYLKHDLISPTSAFIIVLLMSWNGLKNDTMVSLKWRLWPDEALSSR